MPLSSSATTSPALSSSSSLSSTSGNRRLKHTTPTEGGASSSNAAAFERLVEPLVRIERDRVRELDAGQLRLAAIREHGETAIRGIGVQPDASLAAERREVGQAVDRARVRRAGVRDERERASAG